MIRVIVVYNSPIVREGIVYILRKDPTIQVVGEAHTGRDAENLIMQQDFDVVLLGINLPDVNGLEVLKHALRIKPGLKALIFTYYPEDQYAFRAFRDGAWGYLTVDCTPAELLSAVHKIAGGGRHITPSVADMLALYVSLKSDRPLHQLLSNREYEVMCLLAAGQSVTEIARGMSLSVKTISVFRSRILEKLGVKNTPGIIRYAILNHLVD